MHHGIVAGTLTLDALRANREPDERIEPMQGQSQVRNELPGAVRLTWLNSCNSTTRLRAVGHVPAAGSPRSSASPPANC